MLALSWGAWITGLGFIATLCVMFAAKRFEPAGALIVLRTTTYIVIAGLAMMLLGVSFMVALGLR